MTATADLPSTAPVQPGPSLGVDVGIVLFALLYSGEFYKIGPDGTWVDSGEVLVDFSASMPNAAFPAGQRWTIAKVGEGDGPVSYVDSGGHLISANLSARSISTADDGETWAVRADGSGIRWEASTKTWSDQGGPGTYEQIVVSNSGRQWALVGQAPGQPFAILQRTSPGNTWIQAATLPASTESLEIATNAAGDLVCVTADNRLLLYVDQGSTWIQIGGDDIGAQSICLRDPSNAWLVDTSGTVHALGPLLNPSTNPGLLTWDTEDPWDETKSTHLYLVNRASELLGSAADGPVQKFVQTVLQPMVGKDQAGAFRTGMCQGIYDADFLPAYNNPNFVGQATWKSHFYDASTGENYMGETTPTAVSNGVKFLNQSVQLMADPTKVQQAGYNLGLALHYFTDLTQPMHAANYTYLSSLPFGYHTDFEVFTMSVQAKVAQPVVTGFQPGTVNDVATLYHVTSAASKSSYFSQIEQAHLYLTWKTSPGQWQDKVVQLLPQILNGAVSSTAQLLYLYCKELRVGADAAL